VTPIYCKLKPSTRSEKSVIECIVILHCVLNVHVYPVLERSGHVSDWICNFPVATQLTPSQFDLPFPSNRSIPSYYYKLFAQLTAMMRTVKTAAIAAIFLLRSAFAGEQMSLRVRYRVDVLCHFLRQSARHEF